MESYNQLFILMYFLVKHGVFFNENKSFISVEFMHVVKCSSIARMGYLRCLLLQVWTQNCIVLKASVDVNISYY